MDTKIIEKAKQWLEGNYDQETKKEVQRMLDSDKEMLTESFYKDLSFGTGGLRGIMGVGTNRINKYTIGAATQGLSNYIKKACPNEKQIRVVIAHDCRNNSDYFAQITADVFSANGFKVYLFEHLKPTPELSFALRHFRCHSGVVITASHNPKEYNGYKAYWNDGAQVVPPHDKGIIEEVNRIKNVDEIQFSAVKENIEILSDDFDQIYIEQLKKLSVSPEIIAQHADFKIVYTPIHGTGVKLVPETLKSFGFKNVYNVPEQDLVDGNFPTVISPNPENAEALRLALQKAEEIGAELVLATDPDSDRVGIAVKDTNNKFILLNGNQTAALLIDYLIKSRVKKQQMKGNEYIVKTIVTTDLLTDIADKYNVEHFDTLTGFKYIAEIIRNNEGKKQFIGGGEESYGYLAGECVRDKDAVMSAALIAEAAVHAKSEGKTPYEHLIDIYVEFGLYKEVLVNVVKKGKQGAEQIQAMMENFRKNPPQRLAQEKIVKIKDYATSKTLDTITGKETPLDFPQSNVLQFFTDKGSKISVRPSGTEPKIKFYIAVKEDLCCKEKFSETEAICAQRIEALKEALF
ncbi:MAG: phosphoglucomutase [Bacteroidia bacterium]|nr:MAG: phosphoglucomutase [Bacteroidia bacterium]